MKDAVKNARENTEILAAQFDEEIGDLFTAEYYFGGANRAKEFRIQIIESFHKLPVEPI